MNRMNKLHIKQWAKEESQNILLKLSLDPTGEFKTKHAACVSKVLGNTVEYYATSSSQQRNLARTSDRRTTSCLRSFSHLLNAKNDN